ncbi:hypothetical protein [Halodesulfovibrio sp.]|uniref:hypothetical protein n=1 Tax=Halodesulfovibrio sp. TaxID=1912772 RepID=UPI0025B93EC7|nr:hypothetical protein [Halodesulfovibrio sp.]
MPEEKVVYTRPYGVTVTLQPQNETRTVKARSVRQLLNIVKASPTTVLVIRNNELLTSDRKLSHGDEIIVRTVVSSG